jgi:hypothetical protein
MRWSLRRAWVVGGVVAVVAACASPTLPLPPPALPGITKVTEDSVKLTSEYGAEPNAIIMTFNTDPNVPDDKRIGGCLADSFGSWDTTIEAFSQDEIEITQQIGTAVSPPETVTIP